MIYHGDAYQYILQTPDILLEIFRKKEEILKDNDFVAFKNKFNSNVPIKEIYEMYQNSKPKKDIKPIGSMKDTSSNSNEKDFYSPEDVMALTQEEWDKPGTWEKVRKSQRKW